MTENSEQTGNTDQIINDINTTIVTSIENTDFYKKLEPDWKAAAIRLIRNNAIVRVLSNLLKLDEQEVRRELAEKTKDTEPTREFQIAISEGLRLTGNNFESELKNEVKSRMIEWQQSSL